MLSEVFEHPWLQEASPAKGPAFLVGGSPFGEGTSKRPLPASHISVFGHALSLTGFTCLNYLKHHARGKAYCSSITDLHPGSERNTPSSPWPSPSSVPLSPYFPILFLISTLSISLTLCISCLCFPCGFSVFPPWLRR